MRKSQKMRKSRNTHKRQRGGLFDFLKGIFGSKETPPAVGSVPVESNIANKNAKANASANATANATAKATVNAVSNAANSQQGNTTKVVNPTKGGMAPINMKDPMFYPTQKQLEWATTAGLPCTKGGSRRRKHRNKKSKRKSRR